MIVGGDYWFVYNEIYNILYGNGIEFDAFDLYNEAEYSTYWDGNISENLHLYLKVIVYEWTNVKIHIFSDTLEISNRIVGNYIYYDVYNTVYNYLYMNNISYDQIFFYIDQEMTVPWDEYASLNLEVYVKVISYPRTSVIVIHNENGILFDNIIIGYNYSEIDYRVYNYLLSNGYVFDTYYLYTDEAMTIFWDGMVNENQVLYLNVVLYTRTTVYLHHGGEMIEVPNVIAYSYNNGEIWNAISNHGSLYNIDMEAVWSGYITEYNHLYIKIFTEVPVYINGEKNSVYVDYRLDSSTVINDFVVNYLSMYGIPWDDIDYYYDAAHLYPWYSDLVNGLEIHVETIYYARFNVTLNVLGEAFVAFNVMDNGDVYNQVSTAIIGNLNARSIAYSGFDICYDPGFTNLWDHVSLYSGIELFVDVY